VLGCHLSKPQLGLTMYHSESDDFDPRYPFWSKAEVIRVGLITALALFPLSIGNHNATPSAHVETQSQIATTSPAKRTQPGRLTSLRIVPFDASQMNPQGLGDVDHSLQ
jgi:hypothetical protein